MGLLITSLQTVIDVTNQMRPLFDREFEKNPNPPTPQKFVHDRIEMVRKAHAEGRNAWLIDHHENFMKMGSASMKIVGDKFDQQKFAELLVSKHELYTDKPIRAWNELGVVIRIDSKFERFNAIGNRVIHAESSYDTMLDILGYCVLGTLLVREKTLGLMEQE